MGGEVDGFERLIDLGSGLVVLKSRLHDGQEALDVPAFVVHGFCLRDDLRAVEGARGGETGKVIPAGATEQLVDRDAEALALNVPERDIDGAEGGRQDVAALEI